MKTNLIINELNQHKFISNPLSKRINGSIDQILNLNPSNNYGSNSNPDQTQSIDSYAIVHNFCDFLKNLQL